MIEVLISVTIVALVLVSVSDLITRTNKISRLQRQKDDAMAVATSKIATYRAAKDKDPSLYFDPLNLKQTEDCGSETYNQTLYDCKAVFVYPVEDPLTSVNLTVTISWTDQAKDDTSVFASSQLTKPTL